MLKIDQDWQALLIAWLHDPPDKALDIRGHEARARSYIEAVVGNRPDQGELHGLHDQIASAVERLPLPKHDDARAVRFTREQAHCVHPMSGEAYQLGPGIFADSEATRIAAVKAAIENIVQNLTTSKQKFLALWRVLPEKLPWMKQVPADTRVPDHSILQHMDATAAFSCALKGHAAFLSFKLGPVQPFIEASRKTQDLLSGSYILAWLVFHAFKPVLKEYGPTALIYPSLRGVPLVDLWLREECGLRDLVPMPDRESLRAPCLPNRFLALIRASEGERLANACEDACRGAWRELAEKVRAHLDRHWRHLDRDWARLWQQQIDSFFDIRTAWLRLSDCRMDRGKSLFLNEEHRLWFQGIESLEKLRSEIPTEDRYSGSNGSNPLGSWQMALTLSTALMNASSEVRHIPTYAPGERVPPKCSLIGTYEQMGPSDLAASSRFWGEAASKLPAGRLDAGGSDRLCAITLVKRFAFEAGFCEYLGLAPAELQFPDTGSIAGESGYYAALMFDGDSLGKWLDGRMSPKVRHVYHPTIYTYFEKLGLQESLDQRRPVGPALHAAISEALANFSLYIAPAIVRKHRGVLVYSGGDDVLALLSSRMALACALELRRAFSGCNDVNGGAEEGFYRIGHADLLTMGPCATASAGIAVAHFKEDMRFVLAEARRAEKKAKQNGRNQLGLAILRRSGEHTIETCPWEAVGEIQKLVGLNVEGASDRWTYHLRAELEVLESLEDPDAQWREVSRLLARSEGKVKLTSENLESLWRQVGNLRAFTLLSQSASFLARGERIRD